MPVCFHPDSSSRGLRKAATFPGGEAMEFSASSSNCLDIALVNNMPDKALQPTERQFATLLESASGEVVVRLSLYALPDVPRADLGRRHIGACYSSLDSLWDRQIDGLIVTGTEPRAANLRDEPYWRDIAKLIEWASGNTHSSIWSCLAAHAAVLHMDGIARRRLPQKRFGLFEFDRVSEHPLAAGVASPLVIPHSRWNDLPEDQLAACGYTILTRSTEAGADAFIKEQDSLFVLFQGHPEYTANTLLLEYSRDVGRYLRRESDAYPPIPRGYFDRETTQALTALQQRALTDRREDLLAEFPTVLTTRNLAHSWQSSAARLYGNWLHYLCARKEQQLSRKEPARRLLANRRFAAGD